MILHSFHQILEYPTWFVCMDRLCMRELLGLRKLALGVYKDSVTIIIKTNPLWTPSLSHPPSQSPSLMISWRRCSIAHLLEPTLLDVASGDWPKLIAALKSPPKSTLLLTRETLESRRNQVFTSQEPPLKGTRHTWSLLLVLLSLLASGTPTRSSQGPPCGGRDTGPHYDGFTILMINDNHQWLILPTMIY